MLFLTNTFFDIVCYISACARAHSPIVKNNPKTLSHFRAFGLMNLFGRTAVGRQTRTKKRHSALQPSTACCVYISPMFCDKSAKCRKSAFYNMGGVNSDIKIFVLLITECKITTNFSYTQIILGKICTFLIFEIFFIKIGFFLSRVIFLQ